MATAVLKRVADDFFAQSKWADAVGAYQSVIASVDQTPETIRTYIVPTWTRIAPRR